MVTLRMALELAGTTRNAFNYWRRAGLLESEFKKTTPGVAQCMSHENVLEIAFMAALTQVGENPRTVNVSFRILREFERKSGFPRFFVKRIDSPYVQFTNTITDELLAELGAPRVFLRGVEGRERTFSTATAFTIINLEEIKRRVDDLFAEKEKSSAPTISGS